MSETDDRALRARLLQRVGIAFALMAGLLVALVALEPPAETPPRSSLPVSSADRVVSRPVAAMPAPPVPPAAQDSAASPPLGTAVPAVAQGRAAEAETPPAAAAMPGVLPAAPPAAAQCPPPPAAPECPAPPPAERPRGRAMPAGKGYTVQLGVFGDPDNADRLQSSLVDKGLPAHVESRVVLGPFKNKAEAEKAQKALHLKGYARGVVVPPSGK